MRPLLDHAAENGYGLPAVNVGNRERARRRSCAGPARERAGAGDHSATQAKQ